MDAGDQTGDGGCVRVPTLSGFLLKTRFHFTSPSTTTPNRGFPNGEDSGPTPTTSVFATWIQTSDTVPPRIPLRFVLSTLIWSGGR